MRLEDMRDGITDALYYREAFKRLTAAKDTAKLAELQAIVNRPELKFSDYEKARADIRKLILTVK